MGSWIGEFLYKVATNAKTATRAPKTEPETELAPPVARMEEEEAEAPELVEEDSEEDLPELVDEESEELPAVVEVAEEPLAVLVNLG